MRRALVDPSSAEWVDVVDDDDRVVGRVTRPEMRTRNLLHRAVYVFVLNTRGELFVHRRTATKDVYPGYCDLTIGGVVGTGEEYDAAAERELAEELGLIGVPIIRLGGLRYADEGTRICGMVYLTRHDGPFVLQAEEIASGDASNESPRGPTGQACAGSGGRRSSSSTRPCPGLKIGQPSCHSTGVRNVSRSRFHVPSG